MELGGLTDKEVIGLCHMLNTPVFVYRPPNWVRMTPELIDPTLYSLSSDPSIYIVNESQHFTVVLSTTCNAIPGAVNGAPPPKNKKNV